jgi:hypothetical protein
MMGRRTTSALLFLCVCVGWAAQARAACPPPATTVFFVNGLNNAPSEAAASLDALAQHVGSAGPRGCLNFALAYNFTFVPLTFDSGVVDAHVALYRTQLGLGNTVLLVPHSNGNVYADEAYRRLTPAERTSVGVVAVATPLGSVPGNGPHITLVEDTFIAGLPGHLPANTTNTGGACPDVVGCHAFVDVYLEGTASGPRIVQAVSETIPRLVRPPGGAALTLALNQAEFRPGDTFRAGLTVTNSGPPRRIDLYLGLIAPDGVTVFLITSLSPLGGVTVRTDRPERFQPLVSNAELQQGLDLTVPDVLVATVPPNVPSGQSSLFAVMTVAGTPDLAAPIETAELAFTP